MRLVSLVMGLLITISVLAQEKKIPLDTIIRLGGRKVPVIYKQESSSEVTYAMPSKPDSLIKISKKEIEWIYFKSGRRTMYNKPVLSAVSDDQWQTVLVTADPKQTEGLYKVDYVTSWSAKTATTKKKAYESAIVGLQRKAIVKKAYIVLIEVEKYPGAYGDPPRCYLEGSAWGMEPAETGTNVTTGKGKQATDKK